MPPAVSQRPRASVLPVSPAESCTPPSLPNDAVDFGIIGLFLGGAVANWLYAFPNACSFVVSALCIGMLRVPAGASFQAARRDLSEDRVARPWHEYREGLRFMAGTPLILAIGLVGVGWATGGGAAQILFSLFGEMVFGRGAAGIGEVWGCAGIGLIVGRARHLQGCAGVPWPRCCYVVHGGARSSVLARATRSRWFSSASRGRGGG